ncbi:MAG: S8 family serine peptidase [Prevotella sp.]|nr:S8 family serine peptidase [Prevotella sp.]
MKKFLLVLCLLVLWQWAYASLPPAKYKQLYPGGKCYLVRVQLHDKQGTPYTLDHPEAYLSSRSLARRRKQQLGVDSTDLPVSPVYLDTLRAMGLTVVCTSKWMNTVLVRTRDPHVADRLTGMSMVKSACQVFESPDSVPRPMRAAFHTEFNRWDTISHDPYGITAAQIGALKGIDLHRSGRRGRGMMIAVFDGGFMNVDKIPALKRAKIVATRDFVAPCTSDVYTLVEHGTMVFSAMAADAPEAYVGTAPEAQYLLCRTEDTETEWPAEEDYWVAAAEYADSMGVDVINSSLGYHYFDDKRMNYSYADLDGQHAHVSRAASMLAGKGIVLVNSAGNDGMGAWKKINMPADAEDVLTVGAVTPRGMNAPFSSIGPTADGRVKPDVMALGSPTAVISGRGTIINQTGTSFSTPIICGLVACLWQALPGKTACEIIDLVRRSANQYSSPDNIFGYGVPDFWRAYQMGRK